MIPILQIKKLSTEVNVRANGGGGVRILIHIPEFTLKNILS